MVLIAVGQIRSTASMEENLKQCRFVIDKAVAEGAKAVFLPEAADYLSTGPSESLKPDMTTIRIANPKGV